MSKSQFKLCQNVTISDSRSKKDETFPCQLSQWSYLFDFCIFILVPLTVFMNFTDSAILRLNKRILDSVDGDKGEVLDLFEERHFVQRTELVEKLPMIFTVPLNFGCAFGNFGNFGIRFKMI